jgi:hypothetical protein
VLCVREAVPRILETTEVCTDCPYWETRLKAERKDGDAAESRLLERLTRASSLEPQ